MSRFNFITMLHLDFGSKLVGSNQKSLVENMILIKCHFPTEKCSIGNVLLDLILNPDST